MELYGTDFLTPSFVIYVSKHHHHRTASAGHLEVAKLLVEWKSSLSVVDKVYTNRNTYDTYFLFIYSKYLCIFM
jgi:hypothetical protein